MKYQFLDTTNGPVIAGEDEVLFFNDFGPIQDYYDANPEFFKKAYEFLEEMLQAYSGMLVDSVQKETPLDAQTVINKIYMYVGAAEALRGFERSANAKHQPTESHSH